ncbi:hypothetical protein EV126DRAFT_409663 [Verticillium dahliae]|nr:hypothetical protein EV126DRAFT_409663 [Verticillium dahliae]
MGLLWRYSGLRTSLCRHHAVLPAYLFWWASDCASGEFLAVMNDVSVCGFGVMACAVRSLYFFQEQLCHCSRQLTPAHNKHQRTTSRLIYIQADGHVFVV